MEDNDSFYKTRFQNNEVVMVPCSIDGESKVLFTVNQPDCQLTPEEAEQLAMKLKLAAHEAQTLNKKKTTRSES